MVQINKNPKESKSDRNLGLMSWGGKKKKVGKNQREQTWGKRKKKEHYVLVALKTWEGLSSRTFQDKVALKGWV